MYLEKEKANFITVSEKAVDMIAIVEGMIRFVRVLYYKCAHCYKVGFFIYFINSKAKSFEVMVTRRVLVTLCL